MSKEAKVATGDLIRIIVTLNNGRVNAVELKNDTDVIDLRNAIKAIFELDGPAELVVRSPNAKAESLKNPEAILADVLLLDVGKYRVYVEVPPQEEEKEAFFSQKPSSDLYTGSPQKRPKTMGTSLTPGSKGSALRMTVRVEEVASVAGKCPIFAQGALEQLQTEEELVAHMTSILPQFCPDRRLVNSQLLSWNWYTLANKDKSPDLFAVPFLYCKHDETGTDKVRKLRLLLKEKKGVEFLFGTPHPELLDQVYIFRSQDEL